MTSSRTSSDRPLVTVLSAVWATPAKLDRSNDLTARLRVEVSIPNRANWARDWLNSR